MSAVAKTLRALASVLNASRAPWYVFGAQAVAVRGAPRATQDIDRDLLRQLEEALDQSDLLVRLDEAADDVG